MTGISVQDIVDALRPKRETRDADPVYLTVGGLIIEVRCTSKTLLAELLRYFQHVICAPSATPDRTVHVLGEAELPFAVDYVDWAREPGKTGRKDAICNLENGRLVLKVRTGVQFLQTPGLGHRLRPDRGSPQSGHQFHQHPGPQSLSKR